MAQNPTRTMRRVLKPYFSWPMALTIASANATASQRFDVAQDGDFHIRSIHVSVRTTKKQILPTDASRDTITVQITRENSSDTFAKDVIDIWALPSNTNSPAWEPGIWLKRGTQLTVDLKHIELDSTFVGSGYPLTVTITLMGEVYESQQ